jgi:hypothetical protein
VIFFLKFLASWFPYEKDFAATNGNNLRSKTKLTAKYNPHEMIHQSDRFFSGDSRFVAEDN